MGSAREVRGIAIFFRHGGSRYILRCHTCFYGSESKKNERHRGRVSQNSPLGAGIVLTGAKKCLVLVVGGLGGLGGQKKETFSEPGIEPGDSRWQRLMLPLHHSE